MDNKKIAAVNLALRAGPTEGNAEMEQLVEHRLWALWDDHERDVIARYLLDALKKP